MEYKMDRYRGYTYYEQKRDEYTRLVYFLERKLYKTKKHIDKVIEYKNSYYSATLIENTGSDVTDVFNDKTYLNKSKIDRLIIYLDESISALKSKVTEAENVRYKYAKLASCEKEGEC